MNKKLASTVINKEVISSEKNTKKETKIIDNSNKNKVVDIKDKNLKELINKTLSSNRPIYRDITVGEMEQLIELRKQDSGFQPSSLEGLEYAINLEVINISYSPVSDFSPIQNLSKLREIRFDKNRSNGGKGIIDFDLDFLSNFPNLRVFSLNDSYLTNLTNSGNYRGSTNLSLGINRSKLTNLRMLDGWSLRSLGIEGTNIVDFRELNNISIEQFTIGTSYTELPVEGNNGISTFKNPFYDSDGKPVKPHRIGLGGSYDDINISKEFY